MAFKPDENLLNVNFEGYKLSKDALSCVSRSFSPGVRVARLKDEDFSFQHVRAFSLHNHLAGDPWDDTSVYWYAGDCTIQRAKYEVDTGVLTIHPVCNPNTPTTSTDNYVNASLYFINETLCVFSNGQGNLQFLYTGERSSSLANWKAWNVEDSLLGELLGTNFMILAAALSTDGRQVNLATMELKDPSKLRRTTTEIQPVVAVYSWHQLKFTVDVRPESTQLSQLDGDIPGSLVESIKLCCTFQSCAIPLYCEFTVSNLLIISESDILPVDVQKQEPATSMHVEPLEGEEHQGLGYLKENSYIWSQSDTDVSITVHLPEDVKKEDISCIIESKEVVIGLVDGTTHLRGKLCAPIDPDASAWSIERHVLEVTLEKKQPGKWPSLLEGGEEGEDDGGYQAQGLSSHEQLSRNSEEMTTEPSGKAEEDGPSSPKKPRFVQDALEECDETEEDAAFFVMDEDGKIIKRVGLGGHHLLFTAPSTAGSLPLFCLRHDVDAIVWQPLATNDEVTWKHLGTFNALGYVQAAKMDKKFTTCPPSLSFTAISDCNRHVFVYGQPAEGVKGSTALQYVHTIDSGAEILGLQTSGRGLAFVLCEKEVLVLLVK